MKNPYENSILQELYEIRERMLEEAGGSLETLVKQLQARQKETLKKRESKNEGSANRTHSTPNSAKIAVRKSNIDTPRIARKSN